MPFNPDASWFIPFHEHDPSTNDRCIYFTQNETRCLWLCQKRDNNRAIELYESISGLPAEAIGIELIKDYILCNCCRSGRAQHRDRIEDVGLWTPLAERWLAEIRRHATEQSRRTVAVSPLEESAILPDAVTIPATPTPSHATTVYTTPTASSPYFQPSTPTSSSINTTPPTSVASSSAYQNTSPKTPTTSAEITPLPSEGQPHYDLRPRYTNISTNAISVQPMTISQPPRSEFRAHIAEPGPTDSVSSKIRDILVDRDFETGSLYIFDRDSSPGYVKIGWTARSVECRLESWSKCEYTPNLLFSVNLVPHAQRAETLTHYELIKEWRRERQCQAKHCGKSHQEWFEVSKERAKEVLCDWAKFMEIAEPYDSRGVLKARWKNLIKRTVKSGETVTAKKLLEHYELSLAEDTTLVEGSVDPGRALKIEEQEDDLWNTPKLEELEGPKKASVHLDSLRIEQPASTKETLLFKSEASPEPISLAGISLPGPKKQPKSDPLIKFKPLPKSQFSFTAESSFKGTPFSKIGNPFKTETLPRSQFSFTAESSFKGTPLPKIENPFKIEPPPRTQFFLPAELSPKGKTEGLFKTETLPRSQFSFTAELPFKMKPLPKTTESVKTELFHRTPSLSPAESPFKFEPLPKTAASLKTEKFPKAQFSFTSKPPFNIEPLPETGTLPRTNLTFTTETPFKFEPSWKTSVPFMSDSLFGTEPFLKIKPLHEDVPAKRAPADKKLSPEQIPLPPSPLLRPVDSQNTLSIQVTEPSPSPEIEKPSVTDIITKSNTSSAVTPSSESNPLNSSATSSPKPKAKPTSDLPAPLVKEIPGGQEKVITPVSTTQSQHNAGEDGQAKPESELVRCDGQVPENEIKVKDEDEGVVTESKSETGEDGWDEEETLVEVLAPGSLEKTALEIVGGLCNEISTGKTDGLPKALGELKVLESEVLPAVKVVAQA
jgi:hypothetical protein